MHRPTGRTDRRPSVRPSVCPAVISLVAAVAYICVVPVDRPHRSTDSSSTPKLHPLRLLADSLNDIFVFSISTVLPVVTIVAVLSHSTVLRGSCLSVILLYLYMPPSQRSVCDCNRIMLYCVDTLYDKSVRNRKPTTNASTTYSHVKTLFCLLHDHHKSKEWSLGCAYVCDETIKQNLELKQF